jgi:hypothetical protein
LQLGTNWLKSRFRMGKARSRSTTLSSCTRSRTPPRLLFWERKCLRGAEGKSSLAHLSHAYDISNEKGEP